MTIENALMYIENLKWLKGYDNTMIGGEPISEILDQIGELLKGKHGRWINRGFEPIKCSACGITSDALKPIIIQIGMPYCPYCGAKMDLEGTT